jgi:four helix bundle protein
MEYPGCPVDVRRRPTMRVANDCWQRAPASGRTGCMAEQGTDTRAVEPTNGLRRGADIAERLLGLAATIVRLTRKLPRDVGGRHVASQLVRSATSAGANYEEGRAAESRADFIHKLRVAAKEMRETIFWLSLVQRSAYLPSSACESLDALIREGNELVAILMASARTARSSRR